MRIDVAFLVVAWITICAAQRGSRQGKDILADADRPFSFRILPSPGSEDDIRLIAQKLLGQLVQQH